MLQWTVYLLNKISLIIASEIACKNSEEVFLLQYTYYQYSNDESKSKDDPYNFS